MIQRLSLDDATMPGVRLSAEVTTGGELMVWVRDESMPAALVAAGIVLGREDEDALRVWLEKVKDR